MQLDVVNDNNEKVGAIDVRDDVFGGRVNGDLIWESVVRANAADRRDTQRHGVCSYVVYPKPQRDEVHA